MKRAGWFALGCAVGLPGLLRAAEPIVMPPFLVEERTSGNQPHWLHGEDGQFEILSACGAAETEQFVQQVRRQRRDLARVVPEEFLQQSSVPTTLILFPSSRKQQVREQIVRAMRPAAPEPPRSQRLRPMDDLRLEDADSSAIFVFLQDGEWNHYADNRPAGAVPPGGIVFSASYVRFLLQARAPALPDWYVTGMVGLYESAASIRFDYFGTGVPGPVFEDFEPDGWVSAAAARALAVHPDAPRALVPLAELFGPREPTDKPAAYQETWAAEAELFVRWAISTKVKEGREKLHRFVAASVDAPPTEAAFEQAFGLNYADALEALSDYLPTAVRDTVDLGSARSGSDPAIGLEDATDAEIGRIKGDWSRRTLRLIRQADPGSLPVFAAETRRLLEGPYARGDRDPRLLAALALFRIDQGDQAGAAALLASDWRVARARPLAGVELALWRLDQALARPQGAGGAFSAEQEAGVWDGVQGVVRMKPPMESTYLIVARMAEHSGHPPSPEALALLNEGARLFPRDPILVMKCAAWDLRAGDAGTALQLANLGLAEAAAGPMRDQLAVLRDLATKAPVPSARGPGS